MYYPAPLTTITHGLIDLILHTFYIYPSLGGAGREISFSSAFYQSFLHAYASSGIHGRIQAERGIIRMLFSIFLLPFRTRIKISM